MYLQFALKFSDRSLFQQVTRGPVGSLSGEVYTLRSLNSLHSKHTALTLKLVIFHVNVYKIAVLQQQR